MSGTAITGFATQLDNLLDDFLDSDGLIPGNQTALEAKLVDMELIELYTIGWRRLKIVITANSTQWIPY